VVGMGSAAVRASTPCYELDRLLSSTIYQCISEETTSTKMPFSNPRCSSESSPIERNQTRQSHKKSREWKKTVYSSATLSPGSKSEC